MTPTQTGHRQHEEAMQFPTDRLKAFIETRLARREEPTRIANAVKAYFGIALECDEIIPFWKGEITLPTQTERRQDKESVQIPADEVQEPLFTRMAPAETPDVISPVISEAATPQMLSEAATPDVARSSIALDASLVPDGARGADAPATQTEHRQDAESLQIPVDALEDPSVARRAALEALGEHVKAKLGIAPDPVQATQTGRRQDQKTMSVLTDELKAFIVKGLARYETPTHVAASVKAQFGIEIDRRQVFAYDPAGSRPPAQRWIDLHAATRAKFMHAVSEIGVAQKVVRLQMLDRFANRAEENNYTERAAGFLAQAAKECGGFYERYARPKAASAPKGSAT